MITKVQSHPRLPLLPFNTTNITVPTMSLPTNLPELLAASSTLSTPSKPRLQALYTFTSTQEVTNPAGYEVNLRWWSGVIEESLREGLLGRGSGSDLESTRGESGQEKDAGVIFTGDRLGFEVDREGLGKALEWTTGDLVGTGRPKGLASVIVSPPERQLYTFSLPLNLDPDHPDHLLTTVLFFAPSGLQPHLPPTQLPPPLNLPQLPNSDLSTPFPLIPIPRSSSLVGLEQVEPVWIWFGVRGSESGG